MRSSEQSMFDAATLLLAALLLLLLALTGCSADAGPQESSDHDGWGLGACLAGLGGDCRGTSWIEHYGETGDPGVDVIPSHSR